MKIIITAVAIFASTLCFAQTPPVSPQPAKPAPQANTAEPNTDPTADTNDTTLLRAQIMILTNAIDTLTVKLNPLQEFTEREAFINMRNQKAQKLQGLINQQAQARQTSDINKAKSHLQDAEKLKAEEAAIAKANDEKKAAAKATPPK